MQQRQIETKSFPGLSEAEARRRLEAEGYNELPSAGRRCIAALFLDVVREPMFMLLVACGAIYLLLGDLHEAAMLMGFVFVVMGITVYQERKTEHALEALRDLSSPRASVIRDGRQKRIPGREVARGDALLLTEGDRVPADAVIRSSINLSIDESLLTGESLPVRKAPSSDSSNMGKPGGDDQPWAFSGTLVVQGMAVAEVLATGARTEMGKIGKALETIVQERTLLQREIARLVRNLAIIGLSLCALVVVVYGMTRGDWLQGLLAGITMAMATLPEEFPVVLTIFLALGAWRMSHKRVLTRKVPAVETLGAATILCVDKTGTLTQNRMAIARLCANGQKLDVSGAELGTLPEAYHELAEFSILASKRDPFDPMERALHRLGIDTLSQTEHLHEDWTLVQEYPLSQQLLALSHVWKSPEGDEYVIAAKGAPEAIADLCHMDEAAQAELSARVTDLANEGLRVLAVARARFQSVDLPEVQHDFTYEYLGLIGFTDPVRPSVPEAIRECYSAGIRVVMITGDYPGTARCIAQEVGLAAPDKCITGAELDAMSDEELRERIREVNIFARVVPEQKLRIVTALKANREIVAMTGDGVNDAPALKAAHIGIAMGGRGTDVARESADLVLLDDDFSSIVAAVRMGRRIFDNIRKAMAYIFAIHVPIAGMSLLPVVFRWPLLLYPVHILFLELIIDPACSVVFEAETEEDSIMTRKPRNPSRPMFGKRMLTLSILQGISVLAIILIVYRLGLNRNLGEEHTRAMAFAALIVANLALIFTNRSWTRTSFAMLQAPNRALWWVMGGAAFFLAVVLYVPYLSELFRFSRPHPGDIAISLVAGLVGVAWFEVLKLSTGRRLRRRRQSARAV